MRTIFSKSTFSLAKFAAVVCSLSNLICQAIANSATGSTAWAQGSQTPQSEWILEESGPEFGKMTVYLSHDAIKVIVHKMNYTLLVRTDEPKQIVYRDKEKLIATTENLKLKDFIPFMDTPTPDAKFLDNGDKDWKGMKCRKLTQKSGTWTYESKDIEIAQKLNEALGNFYGLPVSSSVPVVACTSRIARKSYQNKGWLNQDMHDLRPGEHIIFQTDSWKKIPFKAADFAKPVGYKTTRAHDLLISSDQREQFTSLFDNVLLIEQSSKKKK